MRSGKTVSTRLRRKERKAKEQEKGKRAKRKGN
jgi:hypothetical protein